MTAMKKYIGFLLGALLLGTSCTDTRYDYQMGDTAYFPKSDLQKETLYVMNANDYVYNLWIHKAGYFQNKFAGKVELDYNYLVQYNTENNTDYEMLDEKYYSFESNFVIEAGIDEIAVPVKLKTEQLLQEKGYGIYYIPLSVQSLTPGEDTYLEKSHFILALDVKKPGLAFDGNEGEQRGNIVLDLANQTSEQQIDITAKLDIVTTEELEVTYSYDATLLEGEEASHILPSGGYSYESSVKIVEGERYGENYLTLKPAEMPDGKWVLPIRVGTTNEKVGTNAETNWLKLVVIKGSLDTKIPLEGSHVQGNAIILSAVETVSGEEIADISQFADMSVSVTGKDGMTEPTWITVNKDNGKVKITTTSKNESTYEERIATITLVDNRTWLEKTITVRQGMKDYGTILNKSLWSIVGFSDNISGKSSTFGRLFDNFWPTNTAEVGSGATLSYIEVDKCSEEAPAQFIFDLGENPHQYNAMGLIPRLQWVGNSPQYMKIEVSDNVVGGDVTRSDDVTEWTLVVDKKEAFTNTELTAHDGGNKNDWFKAKQFIKWHALGGDMNHRFIRLSLWGTLSGTICLDEIFVAEK